MSETEIVTPRLVYKGAADETAQTCEVKDRDALDKALKAGWRLTRVDAKHKAVEKPAATLTIPAQQVAVNPSPAPAPVVDKAAKAEADHAAKAAKADADKAAKVAKADAAKTAKGKK